MFVKFLYFCILLFFLISFFYFLGLKRSTSLFAKLKILLKGLIFLFLSLGLIWMVFILKTYNFFHQEKLIAEITCRKIDNEKMELVLREIDKPKEEIFILKGEQWMIGGDILRWKKPLYFLGLSNLYKLTRLNSRYLKAEKEIFSTHFDLNGGTDKFWLFLYCYQKYLPFVEAVYGNSVYTFPKEKVIFRLYVTPSGFSLKEFQIY